MKSRLILASTSPYRRELMDRLHLEYESKTPTVDEDKLKDQKLGGEALSRFLAFKKAESLVQGESFVVLGADQLVSFAGKILGKPKTVEKAVEQLTHMQGKSHEIITSFCLMNSQRKIEHTNITKMKMRDLTETQIRRYVSHDSPLDCAGSYKIEKLGIALFDQIETEDMTAIQGLPLIAVIRSLKEFNFEVP